jgi:hypothetical protein
VPALFLPLPSPRSPFRKAHRWSDWRWSSDAWKWKWRYALLGVPKLKSDHPRAKEMRSLRGAPPVNEWRIREEFKDFANAQ